MSRPNKYVLFTSQSIGNNQIFIESENYQEVLSFAEKLLYVNNSEKFLIMNLTNGEIVGITHRIEKGLKEEGDIIRRTSTEQIVRTSLGKATIKSPDGKISKLTVIKYT